MFRSERLEILVLGSGVGGKLIAWHMAQSGRRTAVVERRWVGGSCPNIACNCQLEEDALYTTAAASAPDRDYSGGSTFLSHERVITFGGDQRFVWNETTSSRVSTAGLSFSSPPSRKTYTGTWNVTVTGGFAWLVLDEDSARGRRTYRLQERIRGTLLLDDKAYSWSRR